MSTVVASRSNRFEFRVVAERPVVLDHGLVGPLALLDELVVERRYAGGIR